MKTFTEKELRNIIPPDFNKNSKLCKKLIETKRIGGKTYWPNMREIIGHDNQTLPFEYFRHWASIASIPLICTQKTSRYIGESLYAAYHDPKCWNALQEDWIGVNPSLVEEFQHEIVHDFNTSLNRIQDLAHIILAEFTNNINKMKSIIEIGAGYGCMCSIIHELGFKGKYTIIDFPEMHPVQEYYLNNQNIFPEFSFEDDNLKPADLVISTWGISETELDYRNNLLSKIIDSKNWLIVAQKVFFGEDLKSLDVSNNLNYFRDLLSNKNGYKEFLLDLPEMNTWDGETGYFIVNEGNSS